ncbi:MAG: acetate kinase, partial [Eggerthellaceae bacterium]|nr:acetate kinase [Eggerthellaceae bacterium]
MNVLVLNAGSSSLKYQLINVENKIILAKGICERVGGIDSFYKHSSKEDEDVIATVLPDHSAAVSFVLRSLTTGKHKVI